jgi:hypothetical protein
MKKAGSEEDFREKLDRSYREHAQKDGGGGIVVNARTLMEWRPPIPQDGDTWGNWRFDAKTLILKNVQYNYQIDLEECDTSANMLDWIFQLCGKTWMTPDDLGHLVQALDDVLRPQANLCSFGTDKKLDVRKYLAQRG